jgi:hypothetical protein
LVIEVEIVNIVHLVLTYGVEEVVVPELQAATQDHILAHHRVLQVELEESTLLTAHRCIGLGVAEVVLGMEVVAAMVATVVAVVAQVVLVALVVLDLITVLTDKINPVEPQVLRVDLAVLTQELVEVAQTKLRQLVAKADRE